MCHIYESSLVRRTGRCYIETNQRAPELVKDSLAGADGALKAEGDVGQSDRPAEARRS